MTRNAKTKLQKYKSTSAKSVSVMSNECEGGVQVVDGTKVEVGIIDVGLLVTRGGGWKWMVAEKLWSLDSVDLEPNKRFSVLLLFSLRKLSENRSWSSAGQLQTDGREERGGVGGEVELGVVRIAMKTCKRNDQGEQMSKRRGPRTEPWGTPEVTMEDLELWESII